MQLNNLIIIPIPCSSIDNLHFQQPLSTSPVKNLSRNSSMRDQISWKKSHSAFKKFKGRKDKQSKSLKNSQTNLPFLQSDPQQQPLNKNFTLVDNYKNFSLLNSQNEQVFKTQQTLDYFDPNAAPFFQYGISYQYIPKEGRVQVIEDQQESLKTLKRSESVKVKRQVSKKEKIQQQVPSRQNITKTQSLEILEPPKPVSSEYFNDPFIIIRASDKRGQFLQSIIRNQHIKKQEYKKNKIIKKGIRVYSKASSNRSFSVYSNQNSQQIAIKQSYQSDQKSDDYGCDELPIIEFDLCRHIKSAVCQQQRAEDMSNLNLFQVKDDSQIFSRIKPFQKNTQILNQYVFGHSKSQQKYNQCDQHSFEQNQQQQNHIQIKVEQRQ